MIFSYEKKQKTKSANVTLTKKREIRNTKEHFKSKFKGILASKFKVPFKIKTESKFQQSEFKGYFKIEL